MFRIFLFCAVKLADELSLLVIFLHTQRDSVDVLLPNTLVRGGAVFSTCSRARLGVIGFVQTPPLLTPLHYPDLRRVSRIYHQSDGIRSLGGVLGLLSELLTDLK